MPSRAKKKAKAREETENASADEWDGALPDPLVDQHECEFTTSNTF